MRLDLSAMLPTLLAAALMGAAAAAQADSCDDVRQQIEDRIRANGVPAFSVSVVDAAASAPGKVVGNCAQGRKKIVYERLDSSESATPPRSATRPVLTECKDGSVPADGVCK